MATPLPPDKLVCFKDKTRVCGPDCMAYIAAPTGPDYTDQQWARCLLLVNTHRTGKHLVVLASAMGEILQKAKTAPIPTVR